MDKSLRALPQSRALGLLIMKAQVFIFSILILASCGETKKAQLNSDCVLVEGYAKKLSEALVKEGVPHKFDAEKGCVEYDPSYRKEISRINELVVGVSPPGGLSISWEGRNDKLVSLLEENGIKTTKYNHYGKEYIAWSFSDYKRVEALLDFEPWQIEMYKELRNNDKRPNQPHHKDAAEAAPM